MDVSSVNKVILVGRLGKDPDVRYTPSGDAVAELSIATSEKFKGREGDFTERTEWHKGIVWRNTAEFAKQYLKKGQLVYAEGKLQTRKWQDKSGNNRYTTEIQVSTLTPLGSWGKNDNGGGNNYSQPQGNNNSVADNGEDDIPF
jgi:single-strand DNA-binding protein